MKKIKGTFYVDQKYLNNKIFCEDLNKNTNYSHSKYIEVRKEFKKLNIEIHTQDILPENTSDFTIYLDFIKRPVCKKKYLIVREPPIIIPENHDFDKLKCFNKVFTWNDELIDNVFFIKYYNQSYDFGKVETINFSEKKEGYVLICSNKTSTRSGENYSLRNHIISFFENKKYNFDFYGFGWLEKRYPNRYVEAFFNRLKIRRPKNKIYKNYKGEIGNKRKKSSQYVFEFAIENSNNLKGYITEKIFDPFFSNTIPIYSGSPNISDYIPDDSFINVDKFSSIDKLIEYTESLSNEKIIEFIKAKDKFLKSKKANIFSSRKNAKIITTSIIDDL